MNFVQEFSSNTVNSTPLIEIQNKQVYVKIAQNVVNYMTIPKTYTISSLRTMFIYS